MKELSLIVELVIIASGQCPRIRAHQKAAASYRLGQDRRCPGYRPPVGSVRGDEHQLFACIPWLVAFAAIRVPEMKNRVP